MYQVVVRSKVAECVYRVIVPSGMVIFLRFGQSRVILHNEMPLFEVLGYYRGSGSGVKLGSNLRG